MVTTKVCNVKIVVPTSSSTDYLVNIYLDSVQNREGI